MGFEGIGHEVWLRIWFEHAVANDMIIHVLPVPAGTVVLLPFWVYSSGSRAI